MWRPIAACALIAGCGYPPLKNTAGTPDGSLDDAPGGGPADGTLIDGTGGSASCLSHWLDGTVAVASVDELTELSTTAADRDPWISADGRRLYFDREPGAKGMSDIYTASRAAATGPFGRPDEVVNLDTALHESRPALTMDELTLVLATDRDGQFTIRIDTRAPTVGFGTPDLQHLQSVNGVGSRRLDPFLTIDGARLYFAPDTGPGGKQEIRVSERNPATGDYGAPMQVGGLENVNVNTADPALSFDERIIVFSTYSTGAGTAELWYAVRASSTGSFGAPVKIPAVNSSTDDVDPMLSADGCELYFASNRDADGKFHLFRAQLAR